MRQHTKNGLKEDKTVGLSTTSAVTQHLLLYLLLGFLLSWMITFAILALYRETRQAEQKKFTAYGAVTRLPKHNPNVAASTRLPHLVVESSPAGSTR